MDEASPWPRRLAAIVGLVVLTVLATGWLSSTARPVETFGAVDSVLLVSDAGPVRVRSMAEIDESVRAELTAEVAEEADGELAATGGVAGVVVRSNESWLVSRPRLEALERDGELVVRVDCPGRFPCRSSVEVFVPDGVALTVVAARDMVEVDSFDGALQVFAGNDGVALGSVTGSASVVSEGPVRGSTLGPAELTIQAVDDPVQLTYLDVPEIVAVMGQDAAVTIGLPASVDYAVEVPDDATVGVDADSLAERRVLVQSDGRVVVEPATGE